MKDISLVGIPQLKSFDIVNTSWGRTCQITTLLWVNIMDCLSCVQHKSEAQKEQPSYLYMPPTLIMTAIQLYLQDKLEQLQRCFISESPSRGCCTQQNSPELQILLISVKTRVG